MANSSSHQTSGDRSGDRNSGLDRNTNSRSGSRSRSRSPRRGNNNNSNQSRPRGSSRNSHQQPGSSRTSDTSRGSSQDAEDLETDTLGLSRNLRLRRERQAREEEDEKEKDPLSRPFRHWTRTRDMWVRFEDIINVEGVVVNGPEQAHLRGLLRGLREICPNLDTIIQSKTIPHSISAMEQARNSARGEDIKRLKDNLNKLFPFARHINDVKETRGFNNLQIGKLLLPPNLASQWDTDIELQQRYQQGLEIPNVCDYGIWMYQNYTADPNNLLAGFLRSEILVRGFRMIFHGLSSVNGQGPSAKATKKGNAQLNNMREVTVPSIAYIATLARFALDSAPMFSAGGAHGTFHYRAFYNSIIKLLIMTEMRDFRENLLAWWNHQVFPYQDPEQADDDDTVHAQMLAQVAAAAAEPFI